MLLMTSQLPGIVIGTNQTRSCSLSQVLVASKGIAAFFLDLLLLSYPCGVIIPLTMGPIVVFVSYTIFVDLV